jgi:hypothetical protein
MSSNLSEGVLELIVYLAVIENEISGADNSAIKRLVGHCVLEEVLHLTDHVITNLRLDVPFSKGIGNFTEPSFTSNVFRIEGIVSHNIKGSPPSVVQVAEPLVMHSHVNQDHGRKVACCS